jgi:hypothetical protein
MGSPSCSSLYFWISSSVMLPELTARYPRATGACPELLPQMGKLLQPHPRADPLEPLDDFADVLVCQMPRELVYDVNELPLKSVALSRRPQIARRALTSGTRKRAHSGGNILAQRATARLCAAASAS